MIDKVITLTQATDEEFNKIAISDICKLTGLNPAAAKNTLIREHYRRNRSKDNDEQNK
jgi:hypothetical protein